MFLYLLCILVDWLATPPCGTGVVASSRKWTISSLLGCLCATAFIAFSSLGLSTTKVSFLACPITFNGQRSVPLFTMALPTRPLMQAFTAFRATCSPASLVFSPSWEKLSCGIWSRNPLSGSASSLSSGFAGCLYFLIILTWLHAVQGHLQSKNCQPSHNK